MADEVIAVYSHESRQRLIQQGGSKPWALAPARARKAQYLVCVENKNDPRRDFAEAAGTQGAVMLLAKITDVIPAPDEPDRWMICFDEYFAFEPSEQGQSVWQGRRNPVLYTTLEEMGLDLTAIKWVQGKHHRDELERPKTAPVRPVNPFGTDDGSVPPLNISQAKQGLAAFYEVETTAIEVLIRG